MSIGCRSRRRRNPILKPLDTIECRDAILTPDHREPEWPVADVVIGNSPFLGGKLLITQLGEDHVARNVQDVRGRGAAAADFGLLLVREGGAADRRGELHGEPDGAQPASRSTSACWT